MTRFKLLIEYDGSGFLGWQRQANGTSVQQVLEEAVFAFCQEERLVQAAGRTDSGVHATGQVAHVDIEKPCDADTVMKAINYHAKPHAVVIRAAEVASDPDFHARFSAIGRSYLYRIINRRAPLALDRGRGWWVPLPLNAKAMQAGAKLLLGQHDFTSFRASHCQAKSPIKTLDRLEISQEGEEISIIAEARSFLHHQVRNMVGSLKLVGEGRWEPEDIAKALAAKDRAAAGPTAPPDGLYLTGVSYPED